MFNFSRRELVGALILAALLVAGLALHYVIVPKPPGKITIEPANKSAAETAEGGEQAGDEIIVHVAGAVARPGVYHLRNGARIFEALAAAGGTIGSADADALNLAAPLFDGQKVRVPYLGESQNSRVTGDGRVNINTAAASDLEKLPGIGPVRAAAIVDFREKNGFFKNIDDLAKVTGIGPKTVESLQELVTVY